MDTSADSNLPEPELPEEDLPQEDSPAVEEAESEVPVPEAAAPRQYRAVHRYARCTARKARLMADLIRGRSANEALEVLEFAPLRAAAMYKKVLRSALAIAAQDESVNLNRLKVVDSRADDGPMLNNRLRWRPGPQGRAMPFAKKTSHLTVVVAEVREG